MLKLNIHNDSEVFEVRIYYLVALMKILKILIVIYAI